VLVTVPFGDRYSETLSYVDDGLGEMDGRALTQGPFRYGAGGVVLHGSAPRLPQGFSSLIHPALAGLITVVANNIATITVFTFFSY
jgi:hypothetical protein